MSPDKVLPSFFLVPDEKVNYQPSVKLGNVIYRVSQPELVLFDPAKHDPPLSLGDEATVLPPPKTLENYNIESSNTTSSAYGLFLKILEFFGFDAHVSLTSGAEVSKRHEIESMTISTFEPPQAFIDVLQAQKSIIDVLECGSSQCAFLITGVVVASGVVFKSLDVKDRDEDVNLGIHTDGVSVGPEGKRSRKRTLKVDWEDKGPTVLAFKVQKLQLRNGKLATSEETEGAYFGTDDDNAEQAMIDADATLDESDVHGMKRELIHDEITAQDYYLYLPNE
ncbi:hypothetical protein F4777DRAFT_571591 [Nemania sp. FL0916]|nr:hypothetical protein F4777DRAFT_571591 [Nemania sp. FL0916]